MWVTVWRSQMTNKILKSILSVATAVLMASLIIVTSVLYQYFGNVQKSLLKDELVLVAKATEKLGEDYLKELDASDYRLTWVAKDGTVIFDNCIESDVMENHADREEIEEAFTTGSGSSIRYSTTLTEQELYEAVRLADGSVLRISENRVTVLVLILEMLQPIFVIVLIAGALSLWMANRMAKRVVEPLNKLNLDKPLENNAYEELSPLLRRIHVQQQKIKGQMRILKQKQDEFDQITENMKEALVLFDNVGRIVSMNSAARILFTIEDYTTDFKQDMQTAIEKAKKYGTAAFYEKRNGREYQFDVSSIESDGHVLGTVVLGFDITEQVNAERNRREFTANVSHELKTPLQSIIGSAELLENGIVKQDDVPRFVGHIRQEATRLISLIEDIIRLSQLDEGASMPQEEVSLRAVSEEVVEILQKIAQRRQISLEVSGDHGVMKGVRRLLYEVIYNLCDNAIKYNHIGGTVIIQVEDTTDGVTLKVQDTGIGIAQEEQEKIFERFYRVDKSHSKQSGGTGLGLSIVKHAVQYHQGKIEIESEVGKGTAISILFEKNAL